MIKIATIIGARPQYIKAFPVSRALKEVGIEECVIDTGQHYDEAMAGSFFSELHLSPPTYRLKIGSGRHGAMTGLMLARIEEVLIEERPDAALVYGDTNSTLAGALAAAKLQIPIIHVEAGLRSFRSSMPEEQNRRVTDHLSSILLCPTATAVRNLKNEGLTLRSSGESLVTLSDCAKLDRTQDLFASPITLNIGDVMVDALDAIRGQSLDNPIVDSLPFKKFALVTIHRAESTDNSHTLEGILNSIINLSQTMPVIFPLHPRTRAAIQTHNLSKILVDSTMLHLVEPFTYGQIIKAQTHAKVVVTDSGGLQKEAAMLGTPCLTLRSETEWIETLESGWNELLGTNPHDLTEKALGVSAPTKTGYDGFGDGKASERIAKLVQNLFQASL